MKQQSVFFTVALVLFCTNIFAQELTDSIVYSIDLDEFVVTGQYEPTHYKKAIHKVEIINKIDLEKRGAVTLEDALQISPAIRLYQDPVLGTSIRMRGVNSSNVAVLMDGVPVIGRLNGALDLSQISMQNVERVEIVEGALSNIYGSNAAGGVINLISKTKQQKQWQFQVQSQIESIGQQNVAANVGYKKGKLGVGIHGRYYNYNQYPVDSLRLVETIVLADSTSFSQETYPFNPKKQIGFGAFVTYNFGKNFLAKANYNYNQEDIIDYGIAKRLQFNPYANDQYFNTIRSDVSLNLKKNWSKLYLDYTTAFNQFDRVLTDKRYYLESDSFDTALETTDTTHFNSFFNKFLASYKWNNNWTTVVGLNYSVDQAFGDRIINREEEDSLTVSFFEIAPFADVKFTGIENLDISASGRITYHSVYKSNFTPSILMRYSVNEKLNFRASYANGYRSPSMKELYLEFIDINHNIIGKNDLKPETSNDLQFTVDYQWQKDWQTSINLYRTQIKNRIELIEYETLKFQYDNISEYEVYGIQPAVKFKLAGVNIKSSASIGYWSTNINADDSPDYGQVFDLGNSASYTFNKPNLIVSFNHRHNGKQPNYNLVDDEVVVRTLEAYDLLDTSISKSFFKNKFNTVIGIKNILNVTDIAITGKSDGNRHDLYGQNSVSTGRNYFLSAKFSF